MNNYTFNIYSLIYFISTIIALSVILLVFKRRDLVEARYIIFFELMSAWWSASSVFEVAATRLDLKLLWSQISYLGITTSPVAFVLFVLAYSKQNKFLTKKYHAILFTFPAITLIMAFTNQYHGLVWPTITINPETNIAFYGHGIWFWLNIAFSYIILFAGILLLIYTVLNCPGHYKSQIRTLVLATTIPILVNIMYVFKINPIPGLDITPIGLILTGLLLTIAILHYKVFELVPIARHTLFENMEDGMLVIDEQGRVLDINTAMKSIINKYNQDLVGHHIQSIFENFPKLLTYVMERGKPHQEFEFGDNCFDIIITPLQHGNKLSGSMIVLRDISERKKTEQEREKLIQDLQNALQEVKELSGLLPICASCKKIRDDSGYWHEVESYVTNHTKAHFSHGICPDCRKKLYPDIPIKEKSTPKE